MYDTSSASQSQSGRSQVKGLAWADLAVLDSSKCWSAQSLSKGLTPPVFEPCPLLIAGWTPLHEASNHGWLKVAGALLRAGAHVNAKGWDDDTPLHDAAVNGHFKVSFAKGTCRRRDEDHAITTNSVLQLVRLLMKHGADAHLRNVRGKTPLDVARQDVVFLMNGDFGECPTRTGPTGWRGAWAAQWRRRQVESVTAWRGVNCPRVRGSAGRRAIYIAPHRVAPSQVARWAMSHRLAIGCIRGVNAVPLVCSARMAWRRSGYEAAEAKPTSLAQCSASSLSAGLSPAREGRPLAHHAAGC